MLNKVEESFTKECVLGIDAALSCTGYSILDKNTRDIVYVNKICTSSKYSTEDRVLYIAESILSIASQYPIVCVGLEDGFVGQGRRSSLQIASVRSSICTVLKMYKHDVKMFQPKEARKLLGLSGNASKEEVYEYILSVYPNHPKILKLGPFNDKPNKGKNSDMYDSIGISNALINHLNQK